MKLNVLSDLHLGVAGMAPPCNEADLVVLAGDIARPAAAIDWAQGLGKPVLYVPGNHEFYGGSLDAVVAELKARSAGTPVRVLDDEVVVVDGVRFLGSTLWTDFALFGPGPARDTAMAEALRLMRDFSRIRRQADADAPFRPIDAAARFAVHAAWLERELARPHAGPTVVVTHHAPSRLSIHPRFAGSLLNACFVSAAEWLVGEQGRAACWIHGHTHDSFDYRLGGTRVVCNPRGYAKDGLDENARFDPDFIVEV